jgi:hypothetical protein
LSLLAKRNSFQVSNADSFVPCTVRYPSTNVVDQVQHRLVLLDNADPGAKKLTKINKNKPVL